ncbi:magnesium/cobalt transporter CorA [Arenibacter sp. GZD96]|uniref:magnesium/cobalt transporter CorA n=1 Tax=Aurantibrevibacter litoralis TaxID=3106030 RepID=UPI002B001789|nr:magnesium/cobalt transporter CorA [Arenibacter sp. GZD-96]MEA1785313.1 magnesium/cobalt transporter CorA [Arenibacter sp. GZD-96]
MSKKKTGLKTTGKKKSRLHQKMGKSPGTITYMGTREGGESLVNSISYNIDGFDEKTAITLEALLSLKTGPMISWINVIGISNEAFIGILGKQFGLNALILEDTVNTNQRPKIDVYEDYIFGVFKMIYLDEDQHIITEHVALVLLENCVLVFQELQDDVFTGVRERITLPAGRIRSSGSDYLFFALLDAIIDNYFLVLEHINHKIEVLEEDVYANPTPEVAQKIQLLKKEILKLRNYIYPVKELVNRLIETENPLIKKGTKLFLKDILDHTIEINDSIQIYREMSISLMEMYMSNMSNKMNEVMKVLTIMASIFIPLTFVAGIYGMNFEYMPELQMKNGYFILLGIMAVLFVLMLMYFKRKKWL